MSGDAVTLRRPDDWHVHLRDGAMMEAVVPYTARRFGRAIVMPNLTPPVITMRDAEAYRARILRALPLGSKFIPLMTVYLTDHSDADEIERGYRAGVFAAAKLYPANATTNSASGVTDLAKIDRVLARMADIGLPLLLHGEVTNPDVDVFDREAVFVERVLAPLVRLLPSLKIVLEHVTTKEAVAFVSSGGPNLAATITAHHLAINRNALFVGGLRPHMYCLPIAKREAHRLALRRVAFSGNPKFFLGSDSAPHAVHDKERDCGCAGIFTAPIALELYAQLFAEDHSLNNLEAFASLNGPRFYGLAPNEESVSLRRQSWIVPELVTFRAGALRPFMAGERVEWAIS